MIYIVQHITILIKIKYIKPKLYIGLDFLCPKILQKKPSKIAKVA